MISRRSFSALLGALSVAPIMLKLGAVVNAPKIIALNTKGERVFEGVWLGHGKYTFRADRYMDVASVTVDNFAQYCRDFPAITLCAEDTITVDFT